MLARYQTLQGSLSGSSGGQYSLQTDEKELTAPWIKKNGYGYNKQVLLTEIKMITRTITSPMWQVLFQILYNINSTVTIRLRGRYIIILILEIKRL